MISLVVALSTGISALFLSIENIFNCVVKGKNLQSHKVIIMLGLFVVFYTSLFYSMGATIKAILSFWSVIAIALATIATILWCVRRLDSKLDK